MSALPTTLVRQGSALLLRWKSPGPRLASLCTRRGIDLRCAAQLSASEDAPKASQRDGAAPATSQRRRNESLLRHDPSTSNRAPNLSRRGEVKGQQISEWNWIILY